MQSMKQIVQTNQLQITSGLQKQIEAQTSATQSSRSSGNCTEQVNKIFLKFLIFYGHIWRSQFKNEAYSDFARKEWSKALQNFDEKLIEQALEACLKRREMPPALAQFVEFCKEISARKKSLIPKKEVLEPRNPDIAHMHMKKIKAILNMK